MTFEPVASTRIYYGWFVVAAAFAVTFVGFGSAYTFSAFLTPLQQTFGASRGAVSLVFSLAGFLYFGLGIVSGPLADRWGARGLVAAGMTLVAAGLILAGLARNLTEVYLAYGLGVGLGVGCAYVPALGAVQRWFVRRRGFASGLAVSGIGVGTLALPPLATLLIETLGWRQAYFVLGLLAAVVGVGMSWFLVNDPRERGLAADGDAAPARGASAASARVSTPDATRVGSGASVREAVASRRFVGLYAACLICSFGVFVPFVHLMPYALDHGVRPQAAVLLLGTIGVGSTAGRFVLGGLADRVGRTRFLVATFLGMALALAIWAAASQFWSLAVFALVFGLAYGAWVAILPAVVMDAFGGRNVGAIIGVLYTSVAFGTLVGPSAAGYVFDLSHSYLLPILIGAAANLVAAVIARMVLRRWHCEFRFGLEGIPGVDPGAGPTASRSIRPRVYQAPSRAARPTVRCPLARRPRHAGRCRPSCRRVDDDSLASAGQSRRGIGCDAPSRRGGRRADRVCAQSCGRCAALAAQPARGLPRAEHRFRFGVHGCRPGADRGL